jgi:hypothetical protein
MKAPASSAGKMYQNVRNDESAGRDTGAFSLMEADVEAGLISTSETGDKKYNNCHFNLWLPSKK